jgi:hypothetical protein
MGAPVGNTNAKRGLTIRNVFEKIAEDSPDRLEAVGRLMYAIALGEEPATVRDRIAAAQVIFDRTYGKAPQAITLGNEGDEPFRTIAWPLPKTILDQ